MKKYANFDENGAFLHLLIEGLHPIPALAIPVTGTQAVALVNEKDGIWKLVDGEVVKTPLPPPAEPEPYVPLEVEGWQAEVAMRITKVDPDDTESQTVWDRVQDLISAMPDGVEKITVQTALARGKIRRDSAGLAQLAPLVPLSEQRIDDLLILADSIQA